VIKRILSRILSWTSCIAPLLGLCLASCSAAAIRQQSSGDLVAKILTQSTSVRFGESAAIQVEIYNASRAAIVLGLQDVLRSYSFTAESNDEIQFEAEAKASVTDRKAGAIYCPGDVPTFVVRPGQALVQVIAVPVSKELRGMAKVDVVLHLRRLDGAMRCGLAAEMDMPASGIVKIDLVGR
jgi:hypothetical protein